MRPDAGDLTPGPSLPGRPMWLPDPAGGCWCDTETWACRGGDIVVVRLAGELDLLTRPVVAVALFRAMSVSPRHVVVDLSDLAFCGLRGYELLIEAASTAAGRGAGFALSGLTDHHHRVLALIRPGARPVVYPSVAGAVTALRAGPVLL